MDKKLLIVLLPLLFSTVFAEDVGASVKSISAEIIINSDLSVSETLTVTGVNNYGVDSSYMYVFLSDLPEDLTVTDANGTVLNYTSFVANSIYTLRLIDELEPNASNIYTLTYSNNNIIQRFDNNFVFSYLFTSYYDLSDFSLELVLPRGFGITQKDVNTISPPSSKLFSDGQQIIIAWEDSMEYLETNTYLVFFERIAFASYSLLWLLVAGFAGFIAGGGLVYYYLKRKRKDIVTMALTSDEKKVVDYVLSREEDVFQNDIGNHLDFSKPKLSKLIHNLKKKNIISITPSGRKNSIRINKKVL